MLFWDNRVTYTYCVHCWFAKENLCLQSEPRQREAAMLSVVFITYFDTVWFSQRSANDTR